jgi:MYXO-CTERM domain-containing protein
VVLSAGCRVTVTAGIDVGFDGKGTVRVAVGLDDDAVSRFGDLAGELRVDDLRQAGWEVDGPKKGDDGLTWVRASRSFSGADEANVALSQLSGPVGPFRDLRLTHSRSLLKTTTRLTGTVDLAAGAAAFADSDLASRVGDTLPLDIDRLRGELGPDADQKLQVGFEADLPGSVRANVAQEGGRAVWRPALGHQLRVEASSEAVALVPLVPVLAAVLLLVVLGAAFLLRRRRRA